MNIVDIVEQFVLGIVNTLSVLLSRLETFISILVEKLIATRRIKEVEADVILKQGSVDENFMDPKERPEYRCRILGHSGH